MRHEGWGGEGREEGRGVWLGLIRMGIGRLRMGEELQVEILEKR